MTRKYSAILPLKPERFPVAFWVLLALTAGCDPFDRELSAGEARKQIEQVFRSDMGEPWTLAPNSTTSSEPSIAIDAGALEGLWRPLSWRTYFSVDARKLASLELTDKGKALFESVRFDRLGDVELRLVHPVNRKLVKVERVREGGDDNDQSVDFTYRWDAPPTVLRYMGRQPEIAATARFTRDVDQGWQLRDFTLGQDLVPFHRDADAEAPGRTERLGRCGPSSVATNSSGPYRFRYRSNPDSKMQHTAEVEVSDVGFTIRRRTFVLGDERHATLRSHFWGDVISLTAKAEALSMIVLMGSDRTIGRPSNTYTIEIADDGSASPPLATVGQEMSKAWNAWHERFVGCLPTPRNAWDGN